MAATRPLRGNGVPQVDPRRELKLFVRSIETPGTFAYGASLHAPAPNLTVQGLGSIPLPLSKESVSVLRGAAELAPFGHGAETKVDESVRRAWQIDGERIGLSSEFVEAIGRQHALKAAKKLGLRAQALGVEARLYKLVMYESGGHFRPHKDTEKEVGMFGTLVVQLPTAQGHEGGALIVRHRSMSKVFAWQDPDGSFGRGSSSGDGAAESAQSSLPVRCAAFYGDCEHELQPVTAGVRLCLLFNLVRTTPGALPAAAAVSGQTRSESQLRFSRAMAAWGRPGGGRGCNADKFILPLEHEYTKASLDFDGLKGRDRAMADALRACREVSLYLATVVKHESGVAEEDYRDRWRRDHGFKRRKSFGWFDMMDDEDGDEDEGEEGFGYGSDSDAEGKVMEEVHDTSVDMEDMTGADDESMDLGIGRDVRDHEVLGCLSQDEYFGGVDGGLDLLFPEGAEPDEREYEGYTGNCSPTLDFWYHRAVLVLWPAAAAVRVALQGGAQDAIRVARKRSALFGDAGAVPLVDLATIVSLAEKGAGHSEQRSAYDRWSKDGRAFAMEASLTVDVLRLCASKGLPGLRSSCRFLRVLAGKTPPAARAAAPAAAGATATAARAPGLRSGEVARAVAALVRAVGWPAVGGEVSRLVKACGLEQAGNVSVLVDELSSLALPQQQLDLAEHDVGVEAELEAERRQQPQQNGRRVKTEVEAEQHQHQRQPQPEPQQGVEGVKQEIRGAQKQGTSDSTGVATSAPSPPSTAASPPGPASQQPQQQQQQQQQQQAGSTVVKTEARTGQLQRQLAAPFAKVDDAPSSVGTLIAGAYVHGTTSNPEALERVAPNALAVIVRELLLDRECFTSRLGTDNGANPLLRFFAGVGSVRFQKEVLAAAIRQLRTQLGGLAAASNASGAASAPASASGPPPPPPPHHCSAAVTLATGFLTRGLQDHEPSAVKSFAEDLLWLSDVLWVAARSDGANGLEQWFTGAVLATVRSGDSRQAEKGQGQLKAVLGSKAVQAAVRGGRDGRAPVLWVSLVSERLRKLEAHAPPVLCWRQPEAVFEGSPQIQQFLRGPASVLAYRGDDNVRFGRIAEARSFIARSPFRRIKANAVAQGSGRGAYVQITKTKEDHERKVRAYAEVKAEAAALRFLLGGNYYSQGASAGAGSRGGRVVGGGAGAAAGGSGAGSAGRPLSTVSGNVGGVSKTAAADARKGGSVRRRPEVEVIDLCNSP